MIPLSRPQKHKERGIQIDLMIIPPQEEGDYLRQYVQEIKFPHHEIYTSIDDDGNYLKAAQANTLFTSQLRQHGITL